VHAVCPAVDEVPVLERALGEGTSLVLPLGGQPGPAALAGLVDSAGSTYVGRSARAACPIYPGEWYMDWELTDPAFKGVDEVRPIRDEIDRRVRELLAELVPSPS